jgi:hypothetical protein
MGPDNTATVHPEKKCAPGIPWLQLAAESLATQPTSWVATDGRTLRLNKPWPYSGGCAHGQYSIHDATRFLHPEDRPRAPDILSRLLKTGRAETVTHSVPDGAHGGIEMTLTVSRAKCPADCGADCHVALIYARPA